MPDVTSEQVLEALRGVSDPDRGEDIVSLEMVQGLSVDGAKVSFSIEVDPARGPELEGLRKEAEEAAKSVPGVSLVAAILTAERQAPPPPTEQAASFNKLQLPTIKSVIAVASGKGGVGKSTTAVNLALAMASGGKRVGIIDADIYGPSIPRMLGVTDQPVESDNGKITPLTGHGIECISMGFMVDEGTPVIWRGPMATGALEQLFADVEWGELDALVVDMPPGTGDIHLTLSQRVPISGVVIVSTPQDIALVDARKGLNMFRKVEVPVYGIIENMSYFLCPDNGKRYYIFGQDGGKREAEAMGVDLLGEVPLDTHIRETSDLGQPLVATEPDSEHAQTYKAIAAKVWEKIAAGG
jgi:ATP-binding protein involved in chromosome partitioning